MYIDCNQSAAAPDFGDDCGVEGGGDVAVQRQHNHLSIRRFAPTGLDEGFVQPEHWASNYIIAELSPVYLRTDEVCDVVCSIELASELIERVDAQPQLWKWVVISVHSALQAAMVCHLSGTANLGSLKQGSKYKKWFSWLESRQGPPPEQPYVADFMVLVDRLKTPGMRLEEAGSILHLTAEEEFAIKLLNELRRELVHFAPKGWSIELQGLRTMVRTIGGLILRIYEGGWAFRHATDEQAEKLRRKLTLLRS